MNGLLNYGQTGDEQNDSDQSHAGGTTKISHHQQDEAGDEHPGATENKTVSDLQRNRTRISKETICDNLSKAVSHFRTMSFALTALCFSVIGISTSGTWLGLLFVFAYGLGLLCHIPAYLVDRLIVGIFPRSGNFATGAFLREVRPAITASRFSLTIMAALFFSTNPTPNLAFPFLIVVIGLLSAAADLTASNKSEGTDS